ncbi:MAG: hypothetical protein ACTSRE_13405 [Promethearchaeota archaeon]
MEPDKKNDSKKGGNAPSDELSSPETEESFYYALNHEIRRNILRLIGENGKGSFTKFKRSLEVSTGTLYHHLDVLKTLVVQDEKKKYILSTLGKHAYSFLIKNYDSMESTKVDERKTGSNFVNWIVKLAPKRIIDLINEKVYLGWIITGIITLVFCVFIALGGINSSYIFFLPYQESLTSGIRIWLGAKFLISLLVVVGFSEFLFRFLFRKPDNTVRFFATISIGLYPMLIYLILHYILGFISPEFVSGATMKIIMIIFQIWSILLISYIQIVTKFIKIERSLLITFLIHFIASSVLLFTSL